MIRNIKTPHLPKGEVRHIILGKKYRNLLENALIQHNMVPIWLNENKFVDERLSGHADLSAAHIGENRIVLSEHLRECEVSDKVNALGYNIEFTANPTYITYPHDAKLNFCIVSDKLIYNPKTAYKDAVDGIRAETRIPVNQGYTKCSVCIVDEQSIITADKMIAEAAQLSGMNVLRIAEPFVALDGFEYGFIGGASFKINADEIAFTGLITDATIRNKIEAFLKSRKIKPVYLTDNKIFDIGSAIPLTEETV